MRKNVKLCIFALVFTLLLTMFSVTAFAADESKAVANDAANEAVTEDDGKLDMNDKPESFGKRAEIALQGTATGMVMVFAVLGLLAVIVTLSKVVCYDIPNKKKEKAKAAHAPAAAPAPSVKTVQEAPAAVQPVTDDGELIAVITAAVAAVIESSEYKNEFVGGFRVVSFKKSTNSAWNRK